MLSKIEHIAIAVEDLDDAIHHYENVWGLNLESRERIEDQGVEEAMLRLGDSYIQLIAPTAPDTTVGRFIASRGQGLHHIAFEVDDLEASLEALRSTGTDLIDERPRRGGRGHSVAFVHPKTNKGLLVELIQRPSG